jgi:hypothetical protein
MRVTKHQAVQVHPVPSHIMDPVGPFPRELFREPEIVDDYEPQLAEDGGGFPLGSTAQNNFKPVKHLRCSQCFARVLETETQNHICEE